MHLKSR